MSCCGLNKNANSGTANATRKASRAKKGGVKGAAGRAPGTQRRVVNTWKRNY